MLPLLITIQYVADAKSSVIDRLSREEKGATAVEYGLIVGLLAVAIVTVLVTLGPQLANLFDTVSKKLPAAPAAG